MRALRPARTTDRRTADLFAALPTSSPSPPPSRGLAPRLLWLALRFNRLPLVAVVEAPTEPWVVIEGAPTREYLVAVNETARAAGLVPGLALSAARARVPALRPVARDSAREWRALGALATRAFALTPLVSLEPPCELLLEIRGSLSLFGGSAALVAEAERLLGGSSQPVEWAVAPTARAALYLVRGRPGTCLESSAGLAAALADLPLGIAGWPESALALCERLGVASLGELRRLPREGVARRLSPSLLQRLDEAYGLCPEPRRRYVPAERFEERIDLPAEIGDAPRLVPALQILLDQLERFLVQRDAAIGGLTLRFLMRARPAHVLRLGRMQPTACAEAWRSSAEQRLERLVLEAPVLALTLRSAPLVPAAAVTLDLDARSPAATEAAARSLVDRLRARCGEAAVYGMCLVPHHRPETAYRRVLPSSEHGGVPSADLLPTIRRPLWLLSAPETLRLVDGAPWYGGPLQLLEGPERIEHGWWSQVPVVRDYYVARDARGVRMWIYRERAEPKGAWFLHGVFG